MKKNEVAHRRHKRCVLKKVLNIMKLTAFLFFLAIMQVVANSSYSQSARLTLNFSNLSLEEVFSQIEQNSEYSIFYSNELLKGKGLKSGNFENAAVSEVLDRVLANEHLSYSVKGKIILIVSDAESSVQQSTTQQAKEVKGKVVDSTGSPLPGVTVIVKGTSNGTITDMNGGFAISNVSASNVLVFTFVGMKTVEMPVGSQTTFNVTMTDETIGLEEVVAVGYGIVKKKDLTGSVSSVKADEIAKVASSNAMQAMQAQIPGLDIQQSNGQAGAGLSINLRGTRSLSASNSPLILVDGIEYGSTLDINPSDIESMDVLKDASSTAIYGTKGANGVILITTKHGKSGKTKVSLNTYFSANSPTNVPKVMYGRKEVQRLIDKANYQADAASGNWGSSNLTAEDILTESLEDFTELEIYKDGSYTNWLDIILQNGLTQNYELAVSGGNEKTTFNLSLGTMYEEGLMKNDAMDRYNAKMVVDHKLSDIFKTGMNLLFTYKNHDSRNSSVFGQAMKMTTITHPYTKDGEIIETPNPRYAAHVNPLMDEIPGNYQHNIESTRVFGNGYLEMTPVKGMVLKSTFAIDRSNSRDGLYQDYKSVGRYQSPGTTSISSEWEINTKYTWENTMTYNTNFGQSLHDLTLLLGHSMNQSVYEQTATSGDAGREHYYKSSFYDLSKILTETTTSAYVKQSMLSYFTRVNYRFKDKYLVTASVRADGSSTLAKGHKWGYFPSTAIGWRMNQESFLQDQNWLENLKLRASWGISGNAAIDPYATLATLSESPVYYYLGGNDIAGNIPNSLGNQDLKWETTAALNFGLDFGIWDNRISGSVDYFKSHTTDLLLYRTVPASSVFPTVISNIGETKGNGIEIALNTSIVKNRNFTYDINWSYSTFKDEVYKLYDNVTRDISGTSALIVGEPAKVFYDFEAVGNWDVGEFEAYKTEWEARNPGKTLGYISAYGEPGTIKLVDRNDDGVLNDDDKKIYNRSPKHIFGMNNSVSYKNLALSVLVYARLGGYVSYGLNSQLNYESANWGDLDYWTLNNRDAKFPSPGAKSSTFGNYGSALLYEKANYIKVKDITLSYNLPVSLIRKAGIGSVKLYGSLKNFITFSNIENYDPERGGAITFPLAKQVVLGANIEF